MDFPPQTRISIDLFSFDESSFFVDQYNEIPCFRMTSRSTNRSLSSKTHLVATKIFLLLHWSGCDELTNGELLEDVLIDFVDVQLFEGILFGDCQPPRKDRRC